MKRVGFFLVCWISLFCSTNEAVAGKVTVTDVAGRAVDVSIPVDKVVLGEGRFLPTLAILDQENPVRHVAAMMADFRRFDPSTFAQYKKKFPAISEIDEIGAGGAASFSSEHAIGVRPDVAIFGLGSNHGPGARDKEVLARLDAAGIPVVVVDFRIDPLVNTPKSIRLLGRLFGRENEAEAFIAFYEKNLGIVHERLKDVSVKPRVFMEIRVGLREQCCETTGNQVMGRFIDWAGGDNIVAEKIPGTHGMVNAEYLLSEQPDFYIATAIGNYPSKSADHGRVILGAGVPAEVAAASLAAVTERPVVSDLQAVKSGNAYAIWHHFYNTPMNVAAVQAMAKWLHPALFADLDPRATLSEYFERFQPMPLDGVYWTGLAAE
ncbi:MAG: ABC transporter substrate-binding protein [Rhodospirillales bacterium]|nr:ABC transporter substrate-binding protein [Rhodospirillales bacterium]